MCKKNKSFMQQEIKMGPTSCGPGPPNSGSIGWTFLFIAWTIIISIVAETHLVHAEKSKTCKQLLMIQFFFVYMF